MGIDVRTRGRSGTKGTVTAQAQAARDAASGCAAASPDKASGKSVTNKPSIPEFDAEESLAELRTLAESAGAKVVGEILQRRDRPDPATLIGAGKLEEIAGAAASVNADLLLFDHDLSASQQRNIEKIVQRRVIDRTQLILDIFARHARTREGQLQVELAQLQYMLPRLAGRGVEMSQLGGGIGTRGPGETQLETDRRKIARRVRHVEQQLENVRRIRAQQRQRRESAPVATVALVGYTNAGKSTLFNALTQAAVLASPRMFATLDPTIRAVVLPSKRKDAAVGHGGIHSQPAAHAGLGVSRHARRGAAGVADSACVRRQQPALGRAGCAGGDCPERTGSGEEAAAAGDEQGRSAGRGSGRESGERRRCSMRRRCMCLRRKARGWIGCWRASTP